MTPAAKCLWLGAESSRASSRVVRVCFLWLLRQVTGGSPFFFFFFFCCFFFPSPGSVGHHWPPPDYHDGKLHLDSLLRPSPPPPPPLLPLLLPPPPPPQHHTTHTHAHKGKKVLFHELFMSCELYGPSLVVKCVAGTS